MAKKKLPEEKYIRQNISMEPDQLQRLMKFCQKEERSMSWVIRQALTVYMQQGKDDSPYLFPTSRKPYGKMTTSAFRNLMKTIGNRADLTCRVYPHKMRKTLGMNLKNRGVDIGTIQEIMGHSSPVVTSQYYAQSTPRTLRSVRERVVV